MNLRLGNIEEENAKLKNKATTFKMDYKKKVRILFEY
jgi:hypothetical protein